MMSRLLRARFQTPRQRLGMGATLATALHLALLAPLVLVVTRAGRSPSAADGTEGDRVDVSTIVGEAGPGLPGLSAPAGGSGSENGAGEPLPPSEAAGTEPTRTSSRLRSAPRPRRTAALTTQPRPTPPARATSVGTPKGLTGAAGTRTLASTLPPAIDVGAGDGERAPLPGAAGALSPSPLAAFRAELKRHMRAAWRAREVYQRIDPHGRMEGSLLITRLQVRLRADGTVEKAHMRDSSGIPALDTEAMSAIRRMKPLSRLPQGLTDHEGGVGVTCSFHVDVGQYRFANHLRRAVAEIWRPARAFMATGDSGRVTRVRLLLNRSGTLLQASVIAPSGVDFLDANALAWAKPGTQLPAPPPAFQRGATQVPVFVAFYHLTGQVHFLWPREDPDAE